MEIKLKTNLRNYRNKISAYFMKNGLIDYNDANKTIEKEREYLYKYSEDEFDNLIKKYYDIKGEVTPIKITNAKKKPDENEILSEYEEQKLFVKWLRDNKIKCQSSGNGFSLSTGNNIHYMSKLKATGLSVGFPDLEVFIGKGKVLYIEMKKSKGGKVSEEQKKWIDWLNNNEYNASICFGHKEAINFVKKFL